MLDRKKHRQEVEALRADCNGKGLLPEEVSGPFDTYLELKAFINKHLPEKFYMEGDQRVENPLRSGS